MVKKNKKTILICLALLCTYGIQAQFRLSASLVDTLICKIHVCPPGLDFTNSRWILNFVSISSSKNTLYISSTSLSNRQDIPDNAAIYINDVDLYFIILNNVLIDTCLQERLIPSNDKKFTDALDSIAFRKTSLSGVVTERSPLRVFQIKRRCFIKQTFEISSRKYIPYLSAPEAFIPLKIVSDAYLYDRIEPWYFDAFGNLNEKYYEAMKPREKMIIRMKQKK